MHCAVKQVAQKSFLDNKKIMKEFSICWGGGVNQHMENSQGGGVRIG